MALPNGPKEDRIPPSRVHRSIHPSLLLIEVGKGAFVARPAETRGPLRLPDHRDRELVRARGVGAEHEGDAVYVPHGLGAARVPPISPWHVRARGQAPEQQPRLVHVIDSLWGVGLEGAVDVLHRRRSQCQVDFASLPVHGDVANVKPLQKAPHPAMAGRKAGDAPTSCDHGSAFLQQSGGDWYSPMTEGIYRRYHS
ncbi:hypothetical protein I4F81_006135 [Pyropia yezoensis]|uniref:Uncharacterized protein n=1 Tax=Pyropia yezoensis TaxID=2788 RepID=A0ACC3BZW7_PYRYE|nr:hypothetical protein I4F81_006135 [Neopyropia yezoensis]